MGIASQYLTVSCLSGTISDNDNITGGESGASAQVNHTSDITTTSGTIGANAISGLAANNYQVLIAEEGTNFPGTTTFTIGDETAIPVLQISSITDDSSCDDVSPTGSATINVIDGAVVQTAANYILNWFSDMNGTIFLTGVTFNGGGNGTAGANTISVVSEGTYYLRVTDNTTNIGCQSDIIAVTIGDDSIDPVINLDSVTDDLVCDGTNQLGDGTATISITEDGSQAIFLPDYSVEWYRGTHANSPGTADIDFLANETNSNNTNSGSANAGSSLVNGNILSLDGLETGSYTVFIAKDNGNASGNGNEGCLASLVFNIEDRCD